jgi:hypothetical protein
MAAESTASSASDGTDLALANEPAEVGARNDERDATKHAVRPRRYVRRDSPTVTSPEADLRMTDARWRTTEEAAEFLGMPVRVLRETLTERARVVGDVTEARFDGLVGRKIGRRWKVWLGERWTSPETRAPSPRAATLASAGSAGHGGKESPHGRA